MFVNKVHCYWVFGLFDMKLMSKLIVSNQKRRLNSNVNK